MIKVEAKGWKIAMRWRQANTGVGIVQIQKINWDDVWKLNIELILLSGATQGDYRVQTQASKILENLTAICLFTRKAGKQK